MNKRVVSAKAMGKIILVGEHSVVYFKPAIAIPFSGVSIEAVISENDEIVLDTLNYQGLLSLAPKSLEGPKDLVEKILKDLDTEEKFAIKINSSIPQERGMGSSAAVAAALTRAIYKYFDKELSDEDLLAYVNFSETIVHGNPSGIDSAIVVYEKPLYFIKGEDIVNYNYSLDAYLIVADTGELGNTKFAVSKVKEYIDENSDRGNFILSELENIVNNTKESLSNNNVDDVAYNMNQAQAYLSELGVSNESIERLVSTAIDNNALAAKLTGGGLGGCVICLVKDYADAIKVQSELEKNGAKGTWLMNMKNSEVR